MQRNGDGTYSENKNGVVSDMAEPGSTFKVVSLMAVLDDGKAKLSDSVETFNGHFKFGNRIMLVYHILKNAGLNVGLAGNVGNSLALQVATCSFDYYVVELSSFQLDGMVKFKADIAILLNITPDHLDRYDHKFQNYIDSKFRILQNQTEADAFIYWENDPVVKAELAKRNVKSMLYPFAIDRDEKTKAFIEKDQLIINTLNSLFTMPVSDLALKGLHNTYNSMAQRCYIRRTSGWNIFLFRNLQAV